MALVTEESPPSFRPTENSPETRNNTAKDEAPATSTASEAQSYRHPDQTVDHRNDDPTRGGTTPDPAAQDIQSQLLQKILRTLEESNETLKESTQTLKASTIAQETGTDTRSRFWATYKRHAEDYDSEFLEKYKDDMDIVLIFSGLFSAVSTTFITGMQSSLSPDPADTTNALLRQLIQATNGSAFAGQPLDPPTWNGPGTTVIWTQSLLYASLCASLLAALGAVLGKQWLGHYRRRGSGTIEERSKRRQQKLNGLEAWHFHAVLQVLPVLLQISLLLFGVALSAYVWTEQSTVGGVVIGTTAFGILFYVSITLASLISPNCPFQTPVSSILPVLLQFVLRFKDIVAARFDDWSKMGIVTAIARTMLSLVTLIPNACCFFVYWVACRAGRLWQVVLHRPRAACDSYDDLESSPLSHLPPDPLKLHIPSLLIDSQGALSIKWLLETSTDPVVLATAAGMVPEVEWPAELDLSDVFRQLREIFKGCFVPVPNDPSQWKLAPFGQERALVFGKAVVHLYCNRFYSDTMPSDWAGNRELPALFACLQRYDTKSATSLFVCAIAQLSLSVGDRRHRWNPQKWHEELPPVPESCRTWVLRLFPHLLAHPLCPVTLKLMAVAEITRWVTSLSPHQHILADCIISATILIGVRIDRKELVKVDKSPAIELLLRQLQQHQRIVRGIVATPSILASLLRTLSYVMEAEIHPGVVACDSESCRYAAVKLGLAVCSSMVAKIQRTTELNQDERDLPRAVIWRYARAALHMSAMASCDDNGMWFPLYGSHRDRQITLDFHWALAFLDHHYRTRDKIAVGDMFIMLSQARDISLWANEPAFVEAIIVAMGLDKPTRVRHTALRTAWEIREALASPDKAILPLLSDFSSALHSALLTNIHSEEDTTAPDSPDRFFYEERDLHYLQIIYTLIRRSGGVWDGHLHDYQHFRRCLSITKRLRLECITSPIAVYLAAIVENLEARGAEHSFTNEDVELLIHHAWGRLVAVTLDLEELLEDLIAFTQRHRVYALSPAWPDDDAGDPTSAQEVSLSPHRADASAQRWFFKSAEGDRSPRSGGSAM